MTFDVVAEAPDDQRAASREPAGTDDLWQRLSRVERRVAAAVDARRATDPDPDDPYRGQYLTPQAADRLLAAAPSAAASRAAPPPTSPPPPPGSRTARLVESFGLSPLDLDLLLVAMAPDLDRRFEQLYGYLNDDLTQRRPTIGLALELCGLSAVGPGRFRFTARSPLLAGGLLDLVEPERPFLSRQLRVPDRVTAHLLGDDEPDGALRGLARVARPGGSPSADPDGDGPADRLAAVLAGGTVLAHLLDQGGHGGRPAVEALAAGGPHPLVVDATALADRLPDPPTRALAREARLGSRGVVLGPLEALEPERPERARWVREVLGALAGVPVVVHGTRAWDPAWAPDSPVVVAAPPAAPERRAAQWRRALLRASAAHPGAPARGTADGLPATLDAVAAYRLSEEQIGRAAAVAVRTAAAGGRPVDGADLRAAVRGQNGAGLARLARRVVPAIGWDDLVLPPGTARQLRELALRARHRDRVLGEWRMRPGGGRGRGVVALFAGESGTGKTMSAEAVAAELGMDLYVVDLSAVVDKYVGETEKNLERVFSEASQVNGILLFDEADAVFGRRSEVRDAHDRHANTESAYLLQRMESFDGIAVLTTNLRANIDEAFTRRLDLVADFPVPDEERRRALWDRCLGDLLPRGDDLDLDFCARRFELAGGSIRACAVTAAYLAAESGKPLGMAHVVAAVLQEYRKLGRLLLESEFGPWLTGGP